MKHVTFGDKAHLMSDDAADTLLEYARVLADSQRADTVTLRAISPDGNTIEASFLLNASTVMLIESASSELDPPDNAEVVAEIKDRINAITRPAVATAEELWDQPDYDIPEHK